VLGLIAVQELTYEEAARICGCRVGMVKSRMSWAGAILKQTYLDRAKPPVGKALTGGASALSTVMASAGHSEGGFGLSWISTAVLARA
jgi:hypothetical protein